MGRGLESTEQAEKRTAEDQQARNNRGQTVKVRRKCYKNCIAWKCTLQGNSFNIYKVIKKYKRINKKNSIK